jgi:catechol 2,3-dioxygenase-like lactoylglutathione lyase family enzyme
VANLTGGLCQTSPAAARLGDHPFMNLNPHASFVYYVPDLGVAADWYRDKLGFEIHGDHRADPGFRWVTAGPPGADWQMIFGDVTTHGEGELADRFRAELGFAPHFMLVCDDVEETVRELEARGVEIAEQPHEFPFSMAAIIKDLYGDAITLADRRGWEGLRA